MGSDIAVQPARLALPGTASEAGWLEARRHGITASEIAVLMGLSPWGSPFELYYRKTGDLPASDQSDRQALGHVLEPWITSRFQERHPEFAIMGDGRTLWAHPDRPWQLATPDRIASELLACPPSKTAYGTPLAVLECKSWGTYDGWGPDGSDEIPVHIRCQVLWQMDVMGVTTGYVACVFLPGAQLRVYEIGHNGKAAEHDGYAHVGIPPRCDACRDLRLMRTEAVSFLARIERQEPPDVDWRPATTDALKQLHPSVTDTDVPVSRMPVIRYRAACAAYKTAGQRKKAAENKLRQLLGDGHRITDARTGEIIARRDVYDVKEHVRKASHVDKLVAVKPKEEDKQS